MMRDDAKLAPNALAAEEALMNPREAPPRTGDDY